MLEGKQQLPLRFDASHKSDVRTQFAALCYRIRRGRPEILLITSRSSRRWIVPKGWPIENMTPAQSALQEAWEEAGVKGRAIEHCLGLFSYAKLIGPDKALPCIAMVYPVKVKALANDYPESHQRRRKWFTRKKAAARVDEAELVHIIRAFDPAARK
ncbi:NUDIX hydrolase [Sediminimonas sp.]|uniref:NUDIX hydrolase n=1 Tax=Sediminimonas sp. TaxID=2823379 RepID=UPI0025F4F83D|nr:NUDIX hydrolase [Sediminimonas sp.]